VEVNATDLELDRIAAADSLLEMETEISEYDNMNDDNVNAFNSLTIFLYLLQWSCSAVFSKDEIGLSER
jgi:hypothetical protein